MLTVSKKFYNYYIYVTLFKRKIEKLLSIHKIIVNKMRAYKQHNNISSISNYQIKKSFFSFMCLSNLLCLDNLNYIQKGNRLV